MEVTLNVDGKEIKAMISAEEWKKIQSQSKKTGYEKGQCFNKIFVSGRDGDLETLYERVNDNYYDLYSTANYYSDETVAKNNIRADALMRKLRRFAAEHGGCLSKKDINKNNIKFSTIYYYENDLRVYTFDTKSFHSVSLICFKSEDAAIKVIEEFKDELIWYFTEYSPMPEGYYED